MKCSADYDFKRSHVIVVCIINHTEIAVLKTDNPGLNSDLIMKNFLTTLLNGSSQRGLALVPL